MQRNYYDISYCPSAASDSNPPAEAETGGAPNRTNEAQGSRQDMPSFYTEAYNQNEQQQYVAQYYPHQMHHMANNVQGYGQQVSVFDPNYTYQSPATFSGNFPGYSAYHQPADTTLHANVPRADVRDDAQASRYQEQSRTNASASRTLACSNCGKQFARRSDLVRHERIHNNERPHQCPQCGKQFIQRSALTVHERVHSGDKPHVCEKCSKPFSDSSSLARHRRIHTGNRPYKCLFSDCGKTFTRKTTLTRHQQTAHDEAEPDTGRATADQSSRGRHSKSSSVHTLGFSDE